MSRLWGILRFYQNLYNIQQFIFTTFNGIESFICYSQQRLIKTLFFKSQFQEKFWYLEVHSKILWLFLSQHGGHFMPIFSHLKTNLLKCNPYTVIFHKTLNVFLNNIIFQTFFQNFEILNLVTWLLMTSSFWRWKKKYS